MRRKACSRRLAGERSGQTTPTVARAPTSEPFDQHRHEHTHLQHFSLADITCRLAGTDLSLEPIGGLANGAAGPKQTLDDLEPAEP